MQISSLIDLIGGRLLNQPSISFIYSFKTDPSKVKEGDLFIALKLDDIELAVKNGAFAVIIENLFPIIDKEIAWIRVDSIKKALVQLTRFKLAHFNLNAFHCDKITYDMLNIFANSSNKKVKFIPNNLELFIKELEDIEDEDNLICTNKDLLNKIYPNNTNFNKDTYEIKNLTEHSLFESSFTYNNIYFPKLKIASIYIPQFIAIYNFLKEELDLSKLKSFIHFKALFLDKNLELIDFGRSDKFIICQNNEELFSNEISYIKSRYKYAKTLFISKKQYHKLDCEQIIIKNIEELKDVLSTKSFNAVYLMDFDEEIICSKLKKLEKQNTLF